MVIELLKMSDETDLDILNNSMDTMVEQFPEELLPVAVMLTARLVCCPFFYLTLLYPTWCLQCESYMRLARETAIQDHLEDNAELDELLASVDEGDKTFAAMGVSKTIGTVRTFLHSWATYLNGRPDHLFHRQRPRYSSTSSRSRHPNYRLHLRK
jgi:hypothetical protein